MQPGDAIDYLSSAKGWIHAIYVGPSESRDVCRCLIRIGGGEALSEVSRRSLRLPEVQPSSEPRSSSGPNT